MKLFFLPFLALMLCNFCSSTPSDKAKESPFTVDHLISKKIADYHIILEPINNFGKNSENKPCIINEEEKYIKFIDVEAFSKIIPKYGTRIRKLSFMKPNGLIPISIEDWAKAHQIVNEHCFEHLKFFDMGDISDKKLKKIPMEKLKKFKNVKILIFVIEAETIKHKLSDLFPGVRDMEINLKADADYSFINCTLEDLKSLDLLINNPAAGKDHRAGPIIGLIKENPKIKLFNIEGYVYTSKIRKAISEYSVHLKELHISLNDEINEPCNFKSVTDAFLDVDAHFHIDSLSFPKLNSLEINYHPEKRDAFHTFFQKHQNLKELTFISRKTEEHISTSDFKKLTADLWDLEAVTVDNIVETSYNEEDLYNFLRGHPELKKFIFSVYDKVNMTDFRNEFGKTWTIETKGSHFSFEKTASNP